MREFLIVFLICLSVVFVFWLFIAIGKMPLPLQQPRRSGGADHAAREMRIRELRKLTAATPEDDDEEVLRLYREDIAELHRLEAESDEQLRSALEHREPSSQ